MLTCKTKGNDLQVFDSQTSQGRLVNLYDKPSSVFRVAFIERTHKRRILNFDEMLTECKSWQLPMGTKYTTVECQAINMDNPEEFLQTLGRLRSIDALVSLIFIALRHSFLSDVKCISGGNAWCWLDQP